MDDLFSYIVTFIGLIGFWLAGRKVWWAWYVNIANQFAWVTFALITEYYAFLIGTAFYLVVFARNAHLWTTEHFDEGDAVFESELKKIPPPIVGDMLEMRRDEFGLTATFKLNDLGMGMMASGKMNGILIDPMHPGPHITPAPEE